MCGICGIFNQNNVSVDNKDLKRMSDSITHRGPDESGEFIFENIGIASRRLSIIDIAGGTQPIHNEDGSVWVVQNGEIYNFKELREDLIKQGHKFYTKTDSEVLVHLYEEKGTDMPKYLNGMFAIAIIDKNKRSLFLARDRTGQKPLYYYHKDGFFAFASELKGLLTLPQVKKNVDRKALFYYLMLEYIPAPFSIIENVRKLEMGHSMKVTNKNIKFNEYWSHLASINQPQGNINFKRAVDELDNKLKLSIQRRMISDVPIGVFLSGGIDSSSIVSYMTELTDPSNINTFSIGFEEESFDESSYARKVANIFGTKHKEKIFSPGDSHQIINEVFSFLDEPFADASIIPTYLLSKFTAENVKVALGGDGGDEVFYGYQPFKAFKLARYYKILPKFINKIIKGATKLLPVSYENISFDFKVKQFLRGIDFSNNYILAAWMGAFLPEEADRMLPGQGFGNEVQGEVENNIAQMPIKNFMEMAQLFYYYYYLPNDILVKVDRASMASSLEVRAPYLDFELIEFANALPTSYKMPGLNLKSILKKTLQKRLPAEIISRPKKGFGLPVGKWFQTVLKDNLLDCLNESYIRQQGIFEYSEIMPLVDAHLSGKKDNRKQLWTLFVFQNWYEKFIK